MRGSGFAGAAVDEDVARGGDVGDSFLGDAAGDAAGVDAGLSTSKDEPETLGESGVDVPDMGGPGSLLLQSSARDNTMNRLALLVKL